MFLQLFIAGVNCENFSNCDEEDDELEMLLVLAGVTRGLCSAIGVRLSELRPADRAVRA